MLAAKVHVYDKNGIVSEIGVPTSGYDPSNRFWKVFGLNAETQRVITYNQVVASM